MSRRENEPSRTINFCICLFVCLFIFPPLAQVSTLIFFTLEIFPGCQAPTFFLALFHNEAKSQKFCICVHFGRIHQHLSSTCPIWSLNPPLQKKDKLSFYNLFLHSVEACWKFLSSRLSCRFLLTQRYSPRCFSFPLIRPAPRKSVAKIGRKGSAPKLSPPFVTRCECTRWTEENTDILRDRTTKYRRFFHFCFCCGLLFFIFSDLNF